MKLADIDQALEFLTPHERAELAALLAADRETAIWRPLPGPQTDAYYSEADIIGYGGAAGGGKTDLACGLALTKHTNAAIFRREATQLVGVIERLAELLGGRDGYNGQEKIWRGAGPRGVKIEFGSTPNAGDETKHQGRPKDLLVLDEATNFLVHQVRFLMGWVRTTIPGQKCTTLLTFNPPTTVDGRWIIDFFAPWIDRKFQGPKADPGECRWCAVIPGADGVAVDTWLEDGRPFVFHKGERLYEFDPSDFTPEQIVKPLRRTFIPSRISDNPYLAGTGYMATLQSMPEPLRSQMLYGDFQAGVKDDPWQVIPTAWVEAAMARWQPKDIKPVMDSVGVDVARGGDDRTVIAPRYGNWYGELVAYPGSETPNGPRTAALVIAEVRDNAPIHIDVIGVGASPYDFLVQAKQQVIGVNVSEKASGTDKSGKLRFFNQRSQLWWQMREALDPQNNKGIALPPDKDLLTELCTPRWELRGPIIYVEGRDEIYDRIKRSVDRASAVLLASLDTPRRTEVERQSRAGKPQREYDPYAGA